MDDQVRWLYRTKKGLDCDILVCDDRYAEEPDFTHLTKFPSGCYTVPSEGSDSKTYESVDLGLSVKWATCNIGGKFARRSRIVFRMG